MGVVKIAVCFKAVPDFDRVVEADWENFSLAGDLGYVQRILGCFDESALETALRLGSAWAEEGKTVETAALTAAPLPSPLVKTLFAAGFDRVADLSGLLRGGPEFRPRQTAALLGAWLTSWGFDLILAGRQAGWADSGLVPLLLGETLGIPVITEAETLAPCPGGIEVRRLNGTRREELRASLPLLITLGNSPVAALRAVTLGARMAVSQRQAEKPEPEAFPGLGLSEEFPGPPRFIRETRSKTCRFLPGGEDLPQSLAEAGALLGLKPGEKP
ncbi:MAG: hypothetical protein LBQ61_03900 [Spirochaetales bacterium]|jgi:electron transfer flavoprotein beta subunit|nr:hypothetical protein [Spirochaetales bacterium]